MFPQRPPTTTSVVDANGMMTQPWVMYFTALSKKLDSSELNFSFVSPNLVWTDNNSHPHTIATQT